MKLQEHPPKVLSIGLDGGTFCLIDPWVKAGYLPNIARLLEQGTRAILHSVILPFTPQAWGSFMTGMNPGNHGVFGFKEMVNGSYSFQFVNNRSIKSRTLWRYLSDHEKKTIMVNIPMTYPPEPVNGILIAGMDAPGIDSDFTYPAQFKDEIFKVVGDYLIHLHVGAGYLDTDKKRRKAVTELIRMVEGREKLILYLMDNYPWDFFAVNFSAIDQVQHHFWRYMDDGGEFSEAILKIYRRVDEAIGRICSKITGETTVYVMSDHGAGPASPYVFFIDEWLRENGLLSFKNSRSTRGFARRMIKFLLTGLSRRLSSESKDVLMRWFPSIRVRSQGYIRRSLIDWSKTRAFSGEHPSTIRINLKGRDPNGVIEPDEYEALRDDLIKKMARLKHPETGECLIERVYKKEELYHGSYLQSAPDLIIHPKDFCHQIKGGPYCGKAYREAVSFKDRKEFFVNGVHRLEGIFIACGKGIKENHVISPLDITDLFPTMLYSLGMEIPRAIDGKVATAIFREDYLAAHPVRFNDCPMERGVATSGLQGNYGEEESKVIEKSLKGLGYID